MKLKQNNKALIKDLELQIDYLVGYAPQSNHWKQEYSLREALIDNTLKSDTTPADTVDKILRIQAKLYDLRAGIKSDQGYLKVKDQDIDFIKQHLETDPKIVDYRVRDHDIWMKQGWCPRYAVPTELWDQKPIYSWEFAKEYLWMLSIDWENLYNYD